MPDCTQKVLKFSQVGVVLSGQLILSHKFHVSINSRHIHQNIPENQYNFFDKYLVGSISDEFGYIQDTQELGEKNNPLYQVHKMWHHYLSKRLNY